MNWLIPLVVSYLVARNDAYVSNPEDVYSSLALVFDTTGSMYDDYQQLRSHAESIMYHVLNRNDTDIKHFVFVPFNDPVVGPVTETFDPTVIMDKLNKVTINGGGDCPEMGVSAVVKALKIVKPNSYVYIFTDASAKDPHMVNEALELIQRKQSQVNVLRTGDCFVTHLSHMTHLSDTSYQTIASIGSGNVFDVDKEDVSKILELVKKSMDTNKVNLLSININQSQLIPSPKKLNIDESITNLQVSVSGMNCYIDLINPVGTKMDEAQGLMTELNLKNVKIVNVLEPIPGEWTLYVTSESAHSIRACGVSSKNVNFGFATIKPENMTQTSHRPLNGANNYILIHCSDVTKFMSCKIQDLYSENKTYSLPILELENKNMILCGPFVPNNNPFYVQVFGKNNNGHDFKRITKTSIIPDDPDAPYINTPAKITAVVGGELHIKCRVESLVPFTVSWKGFDSPQQTWNFNQSSEIELAIRNVTEQHEDQYVCRARNIAGNAESTTNVTVISMPTILEGSDNVTVVLYEGEDYSMTCMGRGKPVPKMNWLMTHLPVSYYDVEHILIINDALRLIIYDATLKDSNVYTCRATNEAGMTEKHYNVVVKAKTTVSVANETVIVEEINNVILHCPLPNMTHQWLKDGSSINDLIHKRADEPHYKLLNNGLKIYNLDVVDNAVYTCMNSNETYTIELKVAFAPYFIKYQPESMMVKRNETVLFDCMATGYPEPKVLWRKMESSLPISHWTLKDIDFLEHKHKLKINFVDWIHNGTYKCIVKNTFGIVKRRFELLVF